MKGRHLIGLDEFSRADLDLVLDRSAELKQGLKSGKVRRSLAGKCVALIFEKASTRTRVSFQVGVTQLGGYPIFLTGDQLQLSRGEELRDTSRVLGRYVHCVVIRANHHQDVVEYARWSSAPVINGLTDLLHPCQILADLFTLREQPVDLDAIKVAFIGDGNNVANSWINAAIHYRFDLAIACPPGYDPDPGVTARARERGAKVTITRDSREAAQGAHALYTDVWVSMGQDAEKERRRGDFAGYQINSQLVRRAAPGAKIMHCLPAHRGEEITDEVMEGPNSIIFDQAENRLHVQKALLELIAGDDNQQ